ncbi:hypothetical protein PG997_010511 [Apiospora hydei]|uniref:Cyanovirin-N domain-containing protein n=1 Tax=Apiospora hydei TaxID=1337664 RepID=A0ABR1VX96_9PEZI
MDNAGCRNAILFIQDAVLLRRPLPRLPGRRHPLAQRATFDYWAGKDCGVPSSGYHLTDRESANECHRLEQTPRPGAVTLSEITPGCELHLYSSTDCNVTTGGDFLAVKGECVVMDGPAEAKFGGFKLVC